MLGALVIVARYRGVHLAVPQLVRDHLLSSGEPSTTELIDIAEASGLRGEASRFGWRDLFKISRAALPVIVTLRNGSAMVLLSADSRDGRDMIVVQDPNANDDALLALDEARFAEAWSGEVIFIKRDYRLRDEEQPFGLGFVMGQILREGHAVRDIVVSALVMALLA